MYGRVLMLFLTLVESCLPLRLSNSEQVVIKAALCIVNASGNARVLFLEVISVNLRKVTVIGPIRADPPSP